MRKKCAIISCKGLGDGLISTILSHNLSLNGYETVTFHNGSFCELSNWFKGLPIKKFPKIENLPLFFEEFDKIFVSHDSEDPFIQAIIRKGKKEFKEKMWVLNPSFSRKTGQQLYYEDALFRREICMVENMKNFCESILKLEKISDKNGIGSPYNLEHRKNKKTIFIHPTSAKKGRSWSRQKFLILSSKLKKMGFQPVFIMSLQEKKEWSEEEVISFGSLDDLAKDLYQAGYFIGNDSGIGHLASSLQIPLVCISRSKRTTDLWRPGWGRVKVVYPSTLIPNISGFRFRDKNWQIFVSVRKVLQTFKDLLSSGLSH